MPQPVPRYAVFGHPVAHSWSPRLHALFASQTGIALDYQAIDAAPDEFAAAVRAFFAAGGRGANVTLPHKGAAFALADVCTGIARRLGVANLLSVLPGGRIEAQSNDGAGMLADLQNRVGADPAGCDVLLLGAGGAARAAAFALQDAGARSLVIANRTFERAQDLADALSGRRWASVCRWDELGSRGGFDLIINATSTGMRHATLSLPSSLVDTRTVVYDLGYGTAARPFTDWAVQAGCAKAVDGLGMLIETAAASFERWHGVRPDTGAALEALRTPPP
ncbi:MAG: shikimate dehydrogenase [Rhodanobacteraceae bacterium]